MKLKVFVFLSFLLSCSLLAAEKPQSQPADSLLTADTTTLRWSADTLIVATLAGNLSQLLNGDTQMSDSVPAHAPIADSLRQAYSPDSLLTVFSNDSIVPDSLGLSRTHADSLGVDTLSMEEMCRSLQRIRIADIDLDRYFSDSKKNDTLQGKQYSDSTRMAKRKKSAEPTDLMTLLRKGEVIRSMIPDSIVVDSAFLAKLHFTPVLLDSNIYRHNPLFNELVFMGKETPLDWRKNKTDSLFYGARPRTLSAPLDTFAMPTPRDILIDLRHDARDYITRTNVLLYTTTFDRLPRVTWTDNERIENKPIKEYAINEFQHVPVVNSNRIVVRRKKFSPWDGRLNSLLQFSQTSVSKNWHQGGYNFFSLLGGLSGYLNYDNHKKMRWENSFEWRTGFNTVTGDTIGPKGGRKAMPSDDVFKINSKFGLKATGDFYYSMNADFQTNFFDNPKGINNYEMKARFLTPIRFNVGVGMEYKYKWLSVNLSPVSFKYIYLTDTTTTYGFFIKPTEFGIPEGENRLAEIGSKLVVEMKDYSPIPELKLNSKLNFYTNYTKVEIDWEIVAEFAINRFLSTRLMLNPRFDNTVILPEQEKAKLQMKQMLTVGISYRIL